VIQDAARAIRRLILEESYRAHVGHIGSALSVADIVAALYEGPLADERPDDPDRHRLMLSKGHAALALYAALQLRGVLSREQLATYCAEGSLLGVHPERALPGIDFSSGSLGFGLSVAAGSALAARLDGSARRVFALLSDAECNEGSTWEAVAFAAHQRLSNLTAIVDVNGQQALGRTSDVLDMSPLGQRWTGFGWEVEEVDGHDVEALVTALRPAGKLPRAVLARTVAGKGVSCMEGQVAWHYWPMTADQYSQALAEIAAV